jgi:endonuclease/exonuclease/phosphatase family metal-dependent hydrolase
MTELVYDAKKTSSILNSVVYNGFCRAQECHTALITTTRLPDGTHIRCVNARLSCAVGTTRRLQQFKTILKNTDQSIPTIYCGDFNIIDNRFFNLATGWARGFKKKDYLVDERRAFQKICDKHNITNIFKGNSTSIFKHPLLQLDHILIPPSLSVVKKFISRKRFGSDHRMLFAVLHP